MLPFIVGAIAGAGAVVAIKNRKEIKNKVVVGATKVKDKACEVKRCWTFCKWRNSCFNNFWCIKLSKI